MDMRQNAGYILAKVSFSYYNVLSYMYAQQMGV